MSKGSAAGTGRAAAALRNALEEEAARLFRQEEGAPWFVLHTRPRAEKQAARHCLQLGIRHYLPLRRSEPAGSGRRGQRRYHFEVPLFTGYMFAVCTRQHRYDLLQTDCLVRTIEVVDQEQLRGELYNIYLASELGAALTLYPLLKKGRWVRVISGPLAGLSGRISARKDEGFRLVLNVSILGSAVAVEVDMATVEAE
ncbi:MAG: UpxY family transcription antiterminator [Candidatus Latescibacteria bacterium]|nr:UpxY family transcription antiterminator [Candidatus Latescibacterota bacterium]